MCYKIQNQRICGWVVEQTDWCPGPGWRPGWRPIQHNRIDYKLFAPRFSPTISFRIIQN